MIRLIVGIAVAPPRQDTEVGFQMGLPKIGTARNEKLGVSQVSEIVFRPRNEGGLGFAYRNQLEIDVGIDGHVEVVDQATDEASGKLVGVQVKGGPSYFKTRIPSGGPSGWIVYIAKSTVEYWRSYAVPVILVVVDTDRDEIYWALGSEGAFEETEDSYKIPVQAANKLDADAAEAIAAIASKSPELIAKLRELSKELSTAVATHLERHRAAWRECRRNDARTWLREFVQAPAQLAIIDASVAAAVLRFAASTAFDEGGDLKTVRDLADDALRRDPDGNDVRLRAGLLVREGDIEGALALLTATREPIAQVARAAILAQLGRFDEAVRVLDGIDHAGGTVTAVDCAEALLVRARLRLADGDLAGAQDAVTRAVVHAPAHAEVRLMQAELRYFEALVAEAVPRVVPPWPPPIHEAYIRRDASTFRRLAEAAEMFRELLRLDWSPARRRQVETWRCAALSAAPAEAARALEFVREVLARDPGHPHILVWAANEKMPIELSVHLIALAAEADLTGDIATAHAYVMTCMPAGQGATLGTWLDAWRDRYAAAGADATWAIWRAYTHVAAGDPDAARSVLAGMDPRSVRTVEAELLTAEARRTGDDSALVRFLEKSERETGEVEFLFETCRAHARAGRWAAVTPHVEQMLRRLPSAAAQKLAILARYHTCDWAGARTLLDESLEAPTLLADGPRGAEALAFRRMRADIRVRTGDVLGAVADLREVVSSLEQAAPSNDQVTPSLVALARAHYFAGQMHELSACAQRLLRREDLSASDSLMLVEVLVYDAPPLAGELWQRATKLGIADADVTRALLLCYQLGFDSQVGPLHARMVELAAAGKAQVEQLGIDDLIGRKLDWDAQRDRVLESYRRGETLTHLVAKFLNEPLVHFYHALPAAHEASSSLRHRFPLQFRDGSRGVPGIDGAGSGSWPAVAPGRLAMDLSGLLLAAHLKVLDEVEAQYAPIRLPSLVIVALREQRDKLQPHQPSRLVTVRRLLAAERLGQVRTWDAETLTLDQSERVAAGNWWPWIALLERARQEGAFVLDSPLNGSDSPYGRPAAVAGPDRLKRLVTVSTLCAFLRREGILDANAFPGQGIEDGDGGNVVDHREAAGSKSRREPLVRGAVLYLTDTGADALANAELLAAAAEGLKLRVDPNEQHARRALVEALPDLKERIAWVEALIRRISDGLHNGRYALLPPADADPDLDDASMATPEEKASSRAESAAEVQAIPSQNSVDEVRAVSEKVSTIHLPIGSASAGVMEYAEGSADDAREGAGVGHRDADHDKADGRASPWSSPTLQCLRSMVVLPPGTVDAVWIDDRWFGRHRLVGATRLTDTFEMLGALDVAGRLSTTRRWTLCLQLRAANVRALPLSAEEILFHLRAAPIVASEVVETPALRVLRQSAAALFEDSSALRVPTPEQLAAGDVGDLNLAGSFSAAVRDAILAVWQGAGSRPSAEARRIAAIQSSWIVHNLHVDLGLLRAHIVSRTGGVPEPALSALDAAAFLFGALRLIPPRSVPSVEESVGFAPEAESLAAAYSLWVFEALVARRIMHDPAFKAALVASLRERLLNWHRPGTVDGEHAIVARLLARQLFGAWPKALQDNLCEDDALMCHLGRRVVSALTIGQWRVSTADFARGAAAILRGDGSASEVVLQALGTAPSIALRLVGDGLNAFTLATRAGDDRVRLQDAGFGVLAGDEATRRSACEALRSVVDVGDVAWRVATDSIVALNDPAERLLALERFRQVSLSHRYHELAARWLAEQRAHLEDLQSPSPAAVLRHLRATLRVERRNDRDSEGSADGAYVPRDVWETAATILIGEDGVDIAFDRFAGLPVPLPEAIRAAVGAMTSDARQAFVRRLVRTPTSPLGFAHRLRALAWLGAHEVTYLRLARRVVRHLVTSGDQTHFDLFRLVASEAHTALCLAANSKKDANEDGGVTARHSPTDVRVDALGGGETDAGLPPDPASGPAAERAAERLIASWFHAHQVVSAAAASDADPSVLVTWLTERDAQRTSELFSPGGLAARDVADPRLLSQARFIAAALQYASEGNALLAGAEDLLESVEPSLRQPLLEQPMPHFDLLRDLSGNPDLLGTLLQPVRAADGTITVGSLSVVSPGTVPSAIRKSALQGIQREPTVVNSWLELVLLTGGEALTGKDAASFWAALAERDLSAMLLALGTNAETAVARLARQAQQPEGMEARDRIRAALLSIGSRSEGRGASFLGPFQGAGAGAARGEAELTQTQEAVVEALYILAHTEATAAGTMRTFARDLATVARSDAAYLRRMRGVLERLVAERPLIEAQACLSLLLEARGA